jgi:putative FmdB family regulatory protein
MPIYEYHCEDCQRRVSLLWHSFNDAATREPVCPRCGGKKLKRLISRVAILHSDESRMDSLADPTNLSGVDENDPKSMARWMRKMAGETGEELGPEFDEVVGRLEAGEDPDDIEKSMPDLGAPDAGGDDFGVMD